MAKYDANNDGVLNYQELAKAPGLRAAVARVENCPGPASRCRPIACCAGREVQRGGYRRPYQRMEETRHGGASRSFAAWSGRELRKGLPSTR